ncbi:E3 ubiquitin-protein ligase RNF5 [Smittium mucronatum]|uniref:RING-type E3 ubiquitin transferase n=1 Tax=Smittium mucronatum TaxID=133383 RepID=A0A1R0H3L3_9FUNG|nr:E3 ubiquitin-protein ligase RNF5 [Smittium mucronatum]
MDVNTPNAIEPLAGRSSLEGEQCDIPVIDLPDLSQINKSLSVNETSHEISSNTKILDSLDKPSEIPELFPKLAILPSGDSTPINNSQGSSVENLNQEINSQFNPLTSTSKAASLETLNSSNGFPQSLGTGKIINSNTSEINNIPEHKIENPDVSEKIADPNSADINSSAENKSTSNDSSNSDSRENTEFTCNICLETASSPVLTVCGHLFCLLLWNFYISHAHILNAHMCLCHSWDCLGQWLERSPTCPVCKAGCERDKVIPIYGRGKEAKDPSRPSGQRPAVPERPMNNMFGWGNLGISGGFHSIGGNMYYPGAASIGIFPGFFGVSYVSFSS